VAPFDSLTPYGWDDHWAGLLSEVPGEPVPGRVVRHDGVALVVATPDGVVTVTLTTRLDPEPTVGDWVAIVDGALVEVLARSSLLRRRAAGDVEQVLAANVDVVLLACGLDRPVKDGRIQRGAMVAADAGAEPVIVLTKAALCDDAAAIADRVSAANPGLRLVTTSVREDIGLDDLRAVVRDRTVALLGESGAGKSSIVNALLGHEAAAVGRVRASDARGRQTTTTRFLHLLPGGGALIDSPGIRSVGLWSDADAVAVTFDDVDTLSEGCRFNDCRHDSEPGCAVKAAIADGSLAPERLAAWRVLGDEADAPVKRRGPKR
jgi:ribosome biogenesis GTPase